MNEKHEDIVAAEFVLKLSNDIIKSVVDILDLVGRNNPQIDSIVSAGIFLSIVKIGEKNPLILSIIKTLLEDKENKDD